MTAASSARAPLLSRQELALVGITALWGATFLIVHTAMDHSGPLFFVGLRFVAAGLISVAVFWRTLAGEPVWGGVVGRLAGDRLPGLALVGAAFIVAGVLVSELKIRRRGEPQPEADRDVLEPAR